MDQQFITETEFGESNFGKRLSYERPRYRDPVFAILYILHVLAVLIIGIYIWVKEYPSISDGSNNTDFNFGDTSLTGLIVAVLGCMAVGILFGVFWLQIMKRFASTIIKTMLFVNIGLWVVVALVGLAFSPSGIFLTVIGAIMALIYSLYTWCIWSRIPFASALLSISSTIISRYQGTIFISLAVIVFNILWIIIWFSCAASYFMLTEKETTNPDGTTSYSEPSTAVIFVLLVSLYWGFQVNRNISHTTTCGVAATWYFTTEIVGKPTPAAFKRTMTTSFGSVCLGSLIVAILQAIRAMLRNAKGRNALIACVAMCLLACIERLIRYFNKYAYAQCAIYGTSFIESAKATWNLFMSRGILAIINDDLTGMAIMCGSFIGAVFAGGSAFGIGYLFYADDEDAYPTFPIALGGYGFVIGFVLCQCVLMVLASAVIALFVCYAEDPAAMNQNRPEEYNRITAAKPTWGDVFIKFHGAARVPVAQQDGPIFEQRTQQQAI